MKSTLYAENLSNKFLNCYFSNALNQNLLSECRAHKPSNSLRNLSVNSVKALLQMKPLPLIAVVCLFMRNLYCLLVFTVQVVLQYVKNFTSLDAIFKVVKLPPETSRKVITGAVCLQPDNKWVNLLNAQLNSEENINVTFENRVCDKRALQDLVTMALPAARKVLAARTRDEFCRLVLMKCTQFINVQIVLFTGAFM